MCILFYSFKNRSSHILWNGDGNLKFVHCHSWDSNSLQPAPDNSNTRDEWGKTFIIIIIITITIIFFFECMTMSYHHSGDIQ